jgi:hypothetical protein
MTKPRVDGGKFLGKKGRDHDDNCSQTDICHEKYYIRKVRSRGCIMDQIVMIS